MPSALRRRADKHLVAVYRTRDGDFGPTVKKLLDGDRLEPIRGHPDARAIEGGGALVRDDTLIFTADDRELARALDRAQRGNGFPARRLRDARRDVDLDDPFLLAVGDLTLARQFVEEPNLQRARAAVPYLRAIARISAGLDLDEDAAVARARIVTDRARLGPQDLPVGGEGELALPSSGYVAGASRDQSRTTTFAARVMRSLFADSRFVAAVERTERDLGIRFEDEVLRQFDCPSASVFEPAAGGRRARFGARSCVRHPDRMRELLPRLAPHLPRILSAMEGLGDEGLLGLLLLAPDAPLTPTALAQLAQIVVKPFAGEQRSERLFTVRGLAAVDAPEQVVFGMIGDAFVVGSDRAMARTAAKLRTKPLAEPAASALRIPIELLPALLGDAGDRVLAAVFGDIEATISADARATTGRARIPYKR